MRAVTVTVEPTAPVVGLKLIAEVTVNVAVGELVSSLRSDGINSRSGCWNGKCCCQAATSTLVEILKDTGVLPKVAVTDCVPSIPVAVTVTVEPTTPVVGLKLIAEVTVNEADGELVSSLKVTV